MVKALCKKSYIAYDNVTILEAGKIYEIERRSIHSKYYQIITSLNVEDRWKWFQRVPFEGKKFFIILNDKLNNIKLL
jgi:hypothetical protein